MENGKGDGRGIRMGVKRFSAKPLYKGAKVLRIAIEAPQLPAEAGEGAARINAFYRDEARRFYGEATDSFYKSAVKTYLDCFRRHLPFRAFEVTQNFETPYGRPPFVSICVDRTVVSGAAPEGAEAAARTTREAATWHLPSGSRVALEDFFFDSSYKNVLYETVTGELRRRAGAEQSAGGGDFAKTVFRALDETRFYLTEGGIALFFPAGALDRYGSGGIDVFEVPYGFFDAGFKRELFGADSRAPGAVPGRGALRAGRGE